LGLAAAAAAAARSGQRCSSLRMWGSSRPQWSFGNVEQSKLRVQPPGV
jgi:hypothetical protein